MAEPSNWNVPNCLRKWQPLGYTWKRLEKDTGESSYHFSKKIIKKKKKKKALACCAYGGKGFDFQIPIVSTSPGLTAVWLYQLSSPSLWYVKEYVSAFTELHPKPCWDNHLFLSIQGHCPTQWTVLRAQSSTTITKSMFLLNR